MLKSSELWLGFLVFLMVHHSFLQPESQAQEAKKKEAARSERPADREYVVRGSIADLVSIPAVRNELKITPELYQKLLDAQNRAVSFETMQQLMRRQRNANTLSQHAVESADPAAALAAEQATNDANAMMAKAKANRDQAIRELLTPAQRKRLTQILLRQEGLRALVRPDIATEVGLSEEQCAQIQEILAARSVELGALTERSKDDSFALKMKAIVEKSQRKIPLTQEDQAVLAEFSKRRRRKEGEWDRLEQRVDARLAAVLTRYQKSRFVKLLGQEFDLQLLTRDAQPDVESESKGKGNR